MNFISVCAGIEAASVAWHPLGWRASLLSEIEKFPRRVLAHHYPTTRQWGDFTALRVRHLRKLGIPLPAILVGGTPCQAFSVAGLRKSLADARGNLTLSFVRLAHALANAGSLRNAVWENVPGVLSTKDNAFGCFLGAIVGADDALPCPKGGSWPNAGMVAGPRARAAWRVLDAQYFRLAQRRRRVFVVVDFGNGADPAAVLFEPVGVLGNSPPSREAQKDVAAAVTGGARKGGGYSTDDVPLTAFAPELARCVATREGSSQDYETTTMVAVDVAPTVRAGGNKTGGDRPYGTDVDTCDSLATVYSIMPQNSGKDFKARGVDVSQPLMAGGPVGGNQGGDVVLVFDPNQITSSTNRSVPTPELCHTLPATPNAPIAFSAKDYGGDAMTDLAPTLRAGGHSGSHANAGVMPAVAFADVIDPVRYGPSNQDTLHHESGVMNTLPGGTHGNGGHYTKTVTASAVRRLTPRECERLQGFPDDYTLLPGYDADGPRYKALGNSMAVPVMRWIGERIALHMPAANDNQTKQDAAA